MKKSQAMKIVPAKAAKRKGVLDRSPMTVALHLPKLPYHIAAGGRQRKMP
jgi:hypothetical protein